MMALTPKPRDIPSNLTILAYNEIDWMHIMELEMHHVCFHGNYSALFVGALAG